MHCRPCISHSKPAQHLHLDPDFIMAPKESPKAGRSGAQPQQTFDPNKQRITRSLAIRIKAAPSHAAFVITELLENILSFLPAKNIFGVMRVSKQFKVTIDNSLALQEMMFLRPGPGARAMASSDGGPYQSIIPYRPFENHTSLIQYVNFKYFTPLFLNLRLESCLETKHMTSRTPGAQCHSELVQFKFEDYAPRDSQTGELSQQSNLLDSQLTDPPCQDINISLFTAYDIPVDTAISTEGKETIYISVDVSSPPVRTGPKISNLITAALALRGGRTTISRVEGMTVRRGKPGIWKKPFSDNVVSNASTNELLNLFRGLGNAHAAAIANRRTQVYLRLHSVVVQNLPLKPEPNPYEGMAMEVAPRNNRRSLELPYGAP